MKAKNVPNMSHSQKRAWIRMPIMIRKMSDCSCSDNGHELLKSRALQVERQEWWVIWTTLELREIKEVGETLKDRQSEGRIK